MPKTKQMAEEIINKLREAEVFIPGSPVPRCTGWCGRCCPGSGSGRTSCCYGWWSLNYVTSRPAAPTKDAAPPAVKAGWSRHPESVVVVLRGNAHVLGEQALNPTYFDLGEHTNGCAAHTGE